MGRQYGNAAADLMKDVLAYLDSKLAGCPDKIANAADIAEKLFAHYPEYLKEFFDGISETSSIPLERLKLCNAAEYVEGCFFCSAMAVCGDYTGGKLIYGRNYDAVNYSEIAPDLVMTVFHPDGEQSAAIVGYAGEIYCVNGINSSGIFIELNNGMPSAGYDIHWELCPSTTLLFEQLFKATSIDDMDRFFRETRSFASFIIGVADRSEARSYEWCYDGVRIGSTTADDGLMACTNHFVNGAWPYPVPDDADSWNSISRRANMLARSLESRGDLDVRKIKAIMSSSIEDGGPWHTHTRYQIVAVPEDLTLHINIPGCPGWTELKPFSKGILKK